MLSSWFAVHCLRYMVSQVSPSWFLAHPYCAGGLRMRPFMFVMISSLFSLSQLLFTGGVGIIAWRQPSSLSVSANNVIWAVSLRKYLRDDSTFVSLTWSEQVAKSFCWLYSSLTCLDIANALRTTFSPQLAREQQYTKNGDIWYQTDVCKKKE